MVPKETDIVVMLNLKRARGTAMWKKLIELRDQDEGASRQYRDFVSKCGLDPLQEIDSLFLALPQDTADSGQFALVIRGSFQEERMVQCMRTVAREGGQEVVETSYGRRKLYSVPGQEGHLAVVAPRIVVLAGKDWVRKVLDLWDGKAAGQGGKDNQALAAIIRRTRTGDALWGAGIVPQSVAERLRGQPELGAAASMKSVSGSVDFDKGMTLHVHVDLGSEADAAALTGKINEQFQHARRDRNVQLLGLSSYFDAIKVEAKGAVLGVRIELSQAQVDDLSERLSGLLKTLDVREMSRTRASPAEGKNTISVHKGDTSHDTSRDTKSAAKSGMK
ncbi:MAG: hypothetical protein RMK29_04855 [Myxococcales bacterium]|nr:hypothetical protein [Myxococcota bacterium]MDW8281019.1 hypothetical protein [Myxococcales bacterium]